MGRAKKADGKRNLCCVVPGCKSDTRKNTDKHEFMKNVEFYPFPTKIKKNAQLRRKWLKMIDRPADYDPPAWHRVCSRHFVNGIMTAQNNIPELFHKNNFKQPLSERPDSSIKKRQILAAIKPSQRKRELKFQNKDIPNETTDVIWIDEKENQPSVFTQEDIAKNVPISIKEVEVETVKDIIDVPEDHSYSFSTTTIKHKSFPTYRDIGIQTDIDSEFIEQLETKLKKANENLKDSAFLLRDRFMKKVLRDDNSICFYTGFPSLHMFNGVFHILDSYETNIKYWNGPDSINEKNMKKENI